SRNDRLLVKQCVLVNLLPSGLIPGLWDLHDTPPDWKGGFPAKPSPRGGANPCGSGNLNLRSDESQQRRTQAARDSSVGGVVLSEELREHVLWFAAKSLGESTANPC